MQSWLIVVCLANWKKLPGCTILYTLMFCVLSLFSRRECRCLVTTQLSVMELTAPLSGFPPVAPSVSLLSSHGLSLATPLPGSREPWKPLRRSSVSLSITFLSLLLTIFSLPLLLDTFHANAFKHTLKKVFLFCWPTSHLKKIDILSQNSLLFSW